MTRRWLMALLAAVGLCACAAPLQRRSDPGGGGFQPRPEASPDDQEEPETLSRPKGSGPAGQPAPRPASEGGAAPQPRPKSAPGDSGGVAPPRPKAAPSGAAGDADGDGIPDNIDKCPNDPEDKDGHQDEDGCPDP